MGDLYTTRADSEFRFVGVRGDPQDAGFQLVRRLEGRDPASADTIATSLNTTRFFSSPKADKQTYTGTFVSTATEPQVTEYDAVNIEQTLTKVRTTKQDSEATLIREDGDPQRAGFKLYRAWKYIHPTSVDTLATALGAIDTYGSPKADRQTYSGKFIQSSYNPVKAEDKTVTLNQMLTKVKTATDSADADLVEIVGDVRVPGTSIKRAWYYIDPSTADTLHATLAAKKSYGSGIKVDEQLYSGKFISAKVVNLPNEDRTVTITQDLTKVATTTDSATAYLFGTKGDPQWAGFQVTRGWKYIDPAAADGLVVTLNGIESYPNGIRADSQLYGDTFINTQVVSEVQDDETTLIRQVLTKVKSATDSADADLVSSQGTPANAGFLITRAWHYVDPTDADTLFTTLNLRKSYASGIKADKQLFSGAFVVASLQPRTETDRSVTIEQTLRKVATATDSASARLYGVEGEAYQTGFKVTRGWPYIAPASADGLMATLAGVTEYSSGIKADSQAYADTYINSGITSKLQEDQTQTIFQTLTKVRSVTDSGSAFLVKTEGDPRRLGYKIMRGWRYVKPSAADGLMVTLNAIKRYAAGVKADGQLYAGTYVPATATSDRAEDQTQTIYQTLTKTIAATNESDATLIGVQGTPGNAGSLITRAWHFIDPTEADTLYATLNAHKSYSTSIKVDNQTISGTFISASVVPKTENDRSVTIEQTLRKAATATDSSSARLYAITGEGYQTGFKITRGWPYIAPASADGLMATLAATTEYTGGIKADSQLYADTFVTSDVSSKLQDDQTHTIFQTLTKVRSVTDSASAFLYGTEGDPQRAGYKITRGWKYVKPSAADGLMVALNGVASYALGIKADGQLYGDTFISSEVTSKREEDQTQTIYQVATKVKSVTDSGDADLLKIEGDPKIKGSSIIRAWHYIDPTDADSLFATLNGITKYSSGIKADGQLYSGVYVSSRVVPEVQDDRTIRITQSCKKVISIASDTSLVRPLIDREKEIIHPFGEGTGTGWGIIYRYLDLDPTTDTKCMAISDTKLEAKMGAAVYTLVDRKTQTMEDRTMTFYLLAQKKDRISWDTGFHNRPHRKMYENRGRGHEQRRLLWYGINRNHHDSVVGDLIDANSDTGFRTVGVTWRDDDLGAKDYEWLQIKSTADTRTDSLIENTHGKEHLALKNKHYDYSDYSSSTLPSDPALTSGHKFVSKSIRMNQRGLFDKVVVQQNKVASNVVTTGVPARRQIQQRDKPKGSALVDSAGTNRTILYDRISSTSADTVIATMGVTDTKFVTEGIGYSDYGDGSARASRQQIRVNKNAKYYWASEQVALGNNPRQITRVWPWVWDTKATALMDSSGDARTDTKYQGYMCYHLQVDRKPHFNGLSDVIQTLQIPNNGAGAGSGNANTDSLFSIAWGSRNVGAGPVAKRIMTFYKYFTDSSAAMAFALASDDWTRNGVAVKEGYVKAKGDGTYDAWQVQYR